MKTNIAIFIIFNSTVLMRSEVSDEPTWCLHYKKKSHRTGTPSTEGEEFWSMFLSLDGQCSSQAFSKKDLMRNTSMYGFLARYR